MMAKCEPFGFLVSHYQAKCIKCLMVGDNIKELLSGWQKGGRHHLIEEAT